MTISLAHQRHIMIDEETTGLNPRVNGITSIAAVNMQDADEYFQVAITRGTNTIPVDNDADTMAFRKEHDIDAQEFKLPHVAPMTMCRKLSNFIMQKPSFGAPDKEIFLWFKPAVFDWAFLERYYAHFNLSYPVDHRHRMDLSSYVAGRVGMHRHMEFMRSVPFAGKPHGALDDAQYQALVWREANQFTLDLAPTPGGINGQMERPVRR